MKVVASAPVEKPRGVARTALWTAAARARESARPDRLFTDPYAADLAGPDGPELLHHFHTPHADRGGNPFLPVRTRWFDDFLRAATSGERGQDGPGCQVVGLGAGLDARAYRFDWPAGTVLFEVDRPALLSYKDGRLAATGARARCDRRAVPADLAADWAEALLAAGFAPGRRTVWFAEGLLFYLPERLAQETLARAAALSAAGSRLAADLIGTGIFRLAYMRPFLRKLAEAGSPWRFGTDEPHRFLESAGWHADEVTEPGAPSAHFGRWPEPPVAADIPNLPRSYLVAASRAR
jgi:methyltransferase (TIGR00027 family)